MQATTCEKIYILTYDNIFTCRILLFRIKILKEGEKMKLKGILFLVLVSSLLIGSACAASVNDFKVNDSYKSIHSDEYYCVFAATDQNSGINIYKNVDDDVYKGKTNDDILEGTIKHDGRDYLVVDNDMKIAKNADNTANFTDMDHATHGVSEVVKLNGQDYVVVFWAKDSSNLDTAKLLSALNDFNKENNVSPVAF